MKRDFSESAKNKLLRYVADVTETTTWGKIGDSISDAGLHVSHWLGILNIKKYVNDLDSYHKKIIDKNNTTAQQIEAIFNNVSKIDSRYQKGISSEKSYLEKMVKLINDLGRSISPTGGNLDMSAMSSVLQADIDDIAASKTTKENIIENENLGAEPVATPTSVDPVNLATGNFIYERRDLSYAGENAIYFHRYYNSKDKKSSALGKGFRHNFDIYVKENEDATDIVFEDGRHVRFILSDGEYISTKTVGDRLYKKDGLFVLKREESTLFFDENGRIKRFEDNNCLGVSFKYKDSNLLQVINDFGDFFAFTYDENGLLCKVEDRANRSVEFLYVNGNLKSCKYSSGRIINYEYSKDGKITESFTGNEKSNILNEYDGQARVVHQRFGDGSEMFFEYDDDQKTVTQIERNGVKTVYYHDDEYRNTKIIYYDGSSEEYMYNDKGQCIKHIDRSGNAVRMSYDNKGNIVQRIDALRRRTNYIYDACNRLLSVSINGKLLMKNTYDKKGNLLSTENASGNKNSIKYDENGHIVMVVSPDGGIEEYFYNKNGDVESFKNHFGGVTCYEYDNLHRVTKITNPCGGVSQYEYSDDGNLVEEINESGDKKSYTYNEKGLLVKTIDYNGAVTERTYNEINKVKELTDACGNKTSYCYDKMWNVSKVSLPNGAETLYSYDKDNNLSEITDSLGETTYFKYDLNGNCISEERNGISSRFYYDSVGRKVKIEYLNGMICKYEYDMFDNIIHIDNEDGVQVYMEYDESNNLTRQSNSEGEIRVFTYTEDGKIKTIEDEFGRITKYEYIRGEDKYSKIIYPDGSCEKFTYDGNGNLTIFIDRYGNVVDGKYNNSNQLVESYLNKELMKRITYDAMGNIKEICNSDGSITKYDYSLKNELIKLVNAEGSVIEYTYNEDSKLLCKIEKTSIATRVTNFEYDVLGRLVKCVDPCGNIEKFEYDCFDNLISKLDKEGITTKYSYTKSGKVSAIEYQDGRHAVFEYDKNDYLCRVDDWTGSTIIENDLCGRAKSITHPNGDVVSYRYNSAGKKIYIQYPSGKEVDYEYDSMLRLTELHSDSQKISYFYDAFGRLEKKSESSGIHTLYSYNSQGLLKSLQNKYQEELLDSVEYEYDVFGRKIKSKKYISDNDVCDGECSFEYDLHGRLKSVIKNENEIIEYEYDPFGNRTFMVSQGERTEYIYNDLNQLIKSRDSKGDTDYAYDRRGNLISINSNSQGRKKFVYGDTNRLESVVNESGECAEYEYNSLGYRISKSVDSNMLEQYTIDLTRQYNNLLVTQSESGAQDYIWDNEIVYINNRSDHRNLYCAVDDLGSPMRLLDGSITEEIYEYDSFGQEITKRKSDLNPFTFIGYQSDSISGLYFAQAREYLPMAGRFVARDFVAGKVDNINSQNEYLYCEDDPKNYVDKNGLFLLTAIVIGVAVGAATSAAVNGVSQGIKIAQGKQDSWKWGEFIGSTVEGAVVGGLGAIPGLGPAASLAVKVGGGAVGAAANSMISQGIDKHKLEWGKVGEDTAAGAVFGAISFGIDKGIGAVKTKIFGKDTTKTTAKSVYKELDKATDGLKKAQGHLDDVINSGHRPSSLTRKTLENAKSEVKDLTNKYFKTWGKEKVMNFVTGKLGILRSSVRTLFGYETVKQVSKKVFKKRITWYSDGKDDILEYLDDYYGTLVGKAVGKCPIYA